MQFRYRRDLAVVVLGLCVLAFAVGLYIVAPTSRSWNLIYLNIPLFLLCFACILGSVLAYRFLPRRWAISFLGGTVLGLSPLLLTLLNLLVFLAVGDFSAVIDFIFNRFAEWLYEPGAIILALTGFQFDIYSSHISETWLLISWLVYTLLAMLIWTMVLAVVLRAFHFFRRRLSRRHR